GACPHVLETWQLGRGAGTFGGQSAAETFAARTASRGSSHLLRAGARLPRPPPAQETEQRPGRSQERGRPESPGRRLSVLPSRPGTRGNLPGCGREVVPGLCPRQ